MSDLDGLVIRTAKRCGMVTGGIHEGLSTQKNRWNATIFKDQDVVHTARHARASVTDRRHNEVAPLGQLVDNGWCRDARIDKFGVIHGLGHAIFGAQALGDVVEQNAGVVFAVVKESPHLTAYLNKPRGERAPFQAPPGRWGPGDQGGGGVREYRSCASLSYHPQSKPMTWVHPRLQA